MEKERLLGSLAEDANKNGGRLALLWKKTWIESKKIWRIAFPAMLTRVGSYGVLVVTQAFIGRVSELDLSAYALIQIITLRLSNGILLGMSSATETLCGQAFGAKQNHMLGIYLQRSWIINLITATIMLPLYIFAAPIYRLLGQEDAIAKEAGIISLYFIPIVYQYAFNMTIQRYLQAQVKNRIVGWLAAGSITLNVFLCWIFVDKLDWGVPGAMAALISSSWLTVLGQFVYVFGGWCPDTWKGFSMSAFTDLWPVVKLSVSSGVMMCLQLWYNAILVLIAGYMKDAEASIAAFSISLNIIQLIYMVYVGLLGTACVRVANELGRGDVEAVKFSIKVLVSTSATIGVFFWILCLAFGHEIAYLFTSDETIAEVVSSLYLYISFSVLLNSMAPVLSGVAVGAGRQGIVAYVNLASYYAIGVTIGVLLAYVADLGIKGIWIGMMIGIAVQISVVAYITWRTDWNEQVDMASKRLKRWFLESKEDDGEPLNGRSQQCTSRLNGCINENDDGELSHSLTTTTSAAATTP